MRWSLATRSLLPSLCLFAFTGACPRHTCGRVAPVTNSFEPVNGTKALLRRVRIGPGGGSGRGAVTTAQAFLINSGDGGCAGQEALLDSWLAESTDLHDAITTAYADYQTNLGARILWFDFFGIMPGPDNSVNLGIPQVANAWTNIGDHLSRVTEFLSGNGLRDPQIPGDNPRLFCSGEAGVPQDWGQAVKDKNGNDVVSEKDPNTGLPVSYLTLNEAFLAIRNKWRGSYPFWISAFNGYAFDNKDPNTMCPATGVDDEGNPAVRAALTTKPFPLALVDKDDIEFDLGQSNRMVILCPLAFNAMVMHSAGSLAQAISADKYPKPGSTDKSIYLDRLVPRSATLYHELYHLTDSSNTPDTAYSLDKVIAAGSKAQAALDSTSHNPESFVYMAMAAYMLLNAPNGKPPVLYNGAAPMPVPAG